MRPALRHILGLALFMLAAALTGCDTMVQDEQEPPELIPPQAFTVQADLFNQRRSGQATIDPHFMAAVMRVWPVSTTLEPRLHVPAQLTHAALDQSPTIDGDAWVWTGTTSIHGEPLSFTLTGRPMGGEVDWTMEIVEVSTSAASNAPVSDAKPSASAMPSADTSQSAVGMPAYSSSLAFSSPDSTAADSLAYPEEASFSSEASAPSTAVESLSAAADSSFVLYTAQTSVDGTEGHWRLFDIVGNERANVLNGQFKIEKANKMELALTIPARAPEHGGDSIVYAQDEDQRRLRWVRADAGHTHQVRWNVHSHEGSITASNYNQGRAACWGKQLDNVDCAE